MGILPRYLHTAASACQKASVHRFIGRLWILDFGFSRFASQVSPFDFRASIFDLRFAFDVGIAHRFTTISLQSGLLGVSEWSQKSVCLSEIKGEEW
jgi:hypothetical protein